MKIDDYCALFYGESFKKKLFLITAGLLLLLAVELGFDFNGENSLKTSFGTLFVALLFNYTPKYFNGAFQRTVKKPYKLLEKIYLMNFIIYVCVCFINTIMYNTVLVAFGNESVHIFILELAMDFLFCSLIPLFQLLENQTLANILLYIMAMITSCVSNVTYYDIKIHFSLMLTGIAVATCALTNFLWIRRIRKTFASL